MSDLISLLLLALFFRLMTECIMQSLIYLRSVKSVPCYFEADLFCNGRVTFAKYFNDSTLRHFWVVKGIVLLAYCLRKKRIEVTQTRFGKSEFSQSCIRQTCALYFSLVLFVREMNVFVCLLNRASVSWCLLGFV